MLLDDYARIYATHCSRETLRPFLFYRVLNAANTNTDAGAPPSLTASGRGGGSNPFASPAIEGADA
jgi:hypothetical protein